MAVKRTCGYGKIILFGEHAVVYGYPALAMSLELGIHAEILPAKQWEINVPSENLQIFPHKNKHVLGKVFTRLLSFFPDSKSYKVTLKPEIPLASGLGSSAATSVALIRMLMKYHHVNFTCEQVNQMAFIAESIFHGTPSGIDNTIACFGGTCYLRDANQFEAPEDSFQEIPLKKLTISRLPATKKLPFLIVNTKRKRNTKKMVEKVRFFKEKNPKKCQEIMEKIGHLALEGYREIKNENYDKLGKLLTQNQNYLNLLGVSCREIDFICQKSIENGAWGAKLTGAGGGGCVIILIDNNSHKLESILRQNGFDVFRNGEQK